MATNQEIFEGKLDALADSINAKAGTSGKKNIDEMKSAVDSIVLPTITIEEIEGGHRIVITDRTGTRSCDVMDGVDGAPGDDGAPGESAPSYVLNWYANPTEAQKQANLTVMNTIRSLDPGFYSLYIINGNYIFPALYVSNSVSNPSFIGLSLQDGTSLKAFQFLGTDLASYQQASWDYVEQTTFDENSQNAGAMSIIASYVDEQVEAAKLIMGANLSSHSSNENIHVTAANKTAWNAKYDKPSGGIPKTDLAQGVQDTLDDVATIDSRIDDIEDVIPSAATTQNQLADKAFVNSSIATETANFVGTFASVAALEAYSGTLTNNDYAFVTQSRQEDPTQIIAYDRYKYNQSAQEWRFEYTLNNSSFTAAQWAAINSAITASLVTNYSAHLADTTVHVTSQNKSDWNAKYDKPSGGIPKTDLASGVQSSLDKADTALQSAPVTSVNTKTGAVSLTHTDVGADASGAASTVQGNLNTHAGNTDIHTTANEKAGWSAKYDKPSGGIPKADLASGVQSSLDKADTALQSAPVTSVNSKTGTVTLSASDVGAIPSSEKGVASGVATLDSNGKVPSSQLPSSGGGGTNDYNLLIHTPMKLKSETFDVASPIGTGTWMNNTVPKISNNFYDTGRFDKINIDGTIYTGNQIMDWSDTMSGLLGFDIRATVVSRTGDSSQSGIADWLVISIDSPIQMSQMATDLTAGTFVVANIQEIELAPIVEIGRGYESAVLPAVSSADNGKTMEVVDGDWVVGSKHSLTGFEDWGRIKRALGFNSPSSVLPLWSQVRVPHSEFGTIVFDVVSHNTDPDPNNASAHTVTLLMRDALPGIQFDEVEALAVFPSGLTAGTYYYDASGCSYSNYQQQFEFTLTQDVPAGGLLQFKNDLLNYTIASVSSFNSSDLFTPIETVTVDVGSSGTDVLSSLDSADINHVNRAIFGSNNYAQSALRQYLNARGDNWWTPQTKFDMPPTYAGRSGFLAGFPSEFISAIVTTQQVTNTNCVFETGYETSESSSEGRHVTYTTEDKLFLGGWSQYGGSQWSNQLSEGTIWQAFSASGSGDSEDRIKYNVGNRATAQWYWMRSCNPDNSHSARFVYRSGDPDSYDWACFPASGAAAACVIGGIFID